jgi:hypothetical protein
MSELAYNIDFLLRKGEEKRLTFEDKCDLRHLAADRKDDSQQPSACASQEVCHLTHGGYWPNRLVAGPETGHGGFR